MRKHVLPVVSVAIVCLLAGCHAAQRMTEARGKHVESFDGSQIVYDAKGSGEPALVFIHGWCCNRGQWDAPFDAFAKDHRVVRLDLAGHGDSSDTRTDWAIENFAVDVQRVVEHLNLRNVILVGHSMGGPVALVAAANMPARVVGVIGVDTLHDAEWEFPPAMIEEFAKQFETDFHGTMDSFFDGMYSHLPDVDPAVLERLKRDALNNEPSMAAGVMLHFGHIDTKRLFRNCPVPIRCINAAEPNKTFTERNRKYNPRFDAVLMQGVGHWPHVEKPAEFNALLREQVALIERESEKADR